MSADHQKILDAIAAAMPTIEPTEAQTAAMQAAANGTKRDVQDFRFKTLLLAGLHIEDARSRYPNLSVDALKRLVANEYLYLSAWMVRQLKRAAGDEISPARFAWVAYAMAEHALSLDWSQQDETAFKSEPGSLRKEVESYNLEQIRGPYIDILFDGAPQIRSGRFVEVEDHTGASISIGEWFKRDDGLWALRIPRS
jgi:hypothetical protein